jgi:hypothetical protein
LRKMTIYIAVILKRKHYWVRSFLARFVEL